MAYNDVEQDVKQTCQIEVNPHKEKQIICRKQKYFVDYKPNLL